MTKPSVCAISFHFHFMSPSTPFYSTYWWEFAIFIGSGRPYGSFCTLPPISNHWQSFSLPITLMTAKHRIGVWAYIVSLLENFAGELGRHYPLLPELILLLWGFDRQCFWKVGFWWAICGMRTLRGAKRGRNPWRSTVNMKTSLFLADQGSWAHGLETYLFIFFLNLFIY